MGYQEALEAAGATVVEFKMFGSYQGDWFALLGNGNIIHDYYGSCSGCDAFEAEFSFNYDYDTPEYKQKLCEFGARYLTDQSTLDELIAKYEVKVAEDYAWEDDKEILGWLKSLK